MTDDERNKQRARAKALRNEAEQIERRCDDDRLMMDGRQSALRLMHRFRTDIKAGIYRSADMVPVLFQDTLTWLKAYNGTNETILSIQKNTHDPDYLKTYHMARALNLLLAEEYPIDVWTSDRPTVAFEGAPSQEERIIYTTRAAGNDGPWYRTRDRRAAVYSRRQVTVTPSTFRDVADRRTHNRRKGHTKIIGPIS